MRSRRTHAIQVDALRGDRYEALDRSEILPGLDLRWLASFLGHESQSQAVRALRAAMR